MEDQRSSWASADANKAQLRFLDASSLCLKGKTKFVLGIGESTQGNPDSRPWSDRYMCFNSQRSVQIHKWQQFLLSVVGLTVIPFHKSQKGSLPICSKESLFFVNLLIMQKLLAVKPHLKITVLKKIVCNISTPNFKKFKISIILVKTGLFQQWKKWFKKCLISDEIISKSKFLRYDKTL